MEVDEILEKISEIELTASDLVEDANQRKKDYAKTMREKTQAYDCEANRKTQMQLERLKKESEEQINAEVTRLYECMNQKKAGIKAYYEDNREELAARLFAHLIKE